MVRTQIQLTEEQYSKLKRMAAARGVSVAEIIRRSVDTTLKSDILPDREVLLARANEVIGAFSDTQADVSAHHDDYLAEAFEE